MAFVEAVAICPGGSAEDIRALAGFSARTARKALPTALTLGLIRQRQGKLECAVDGVRRGMTIEQRQYVFRRTLQNFRPFEALCEGLAAGELPDEAIRKARVLLQISVSEEDKFQFLVRWGKEVGLLQQRDKVLTVPPDLLSPDQTDLTLPTAHDLQSSMQARLFNAARLGRAANNFLDEVDRTLLAEALTSHTANPEETAEKAGQALEDFLREVARVKNLGTQASKLNGASQLATLLCSKGVIHSHHQKLVEAVSAMRTPTAHKKDKRTLSPWEITDMGAIVALLTALLAIRSIHEVISGGRQVL